MNDTLPEIESLYREKLMARGAARKVVSDASMRTSSRKTSCAACSDGLTLRLDKNAITGTFSNVGIGVTTQFETIA